MRRLLLALVSTAAGLAAVLSFKTQGSAATSGAAAAPQTGTQASSSAPASTGSAGSGSGGTASGSGSTSAGSKSSTAGTGGGRTLTGAVSNTPYGPMQVQVTMAAHKITGVKVLQETNDGVMSQQIDANAVPQLNKETLAAQSARIDAVSGASYTSAGYIKSLQSAVDQAKA
jgi:uncharacterized protein with FMN-binding domain